MTRKQRRILIRIIVAAALTVAAWIAPAEGWVRLVLFAVPYAIVGYDVLLGAVHDLVNGQMLGEEFLMGIATVGAFAIGEYPEAVAVMLFFQVGELFQSIAVGRSRRSIAALMDIRPESAVALRDGAEVTLDPAEVEVGETIVVRPGEKIPLDGVIAHGRTTVNTAALTGESLPADKQEGDRVVSGTINITGLIRVVTESRYEESTVAKILELVESASEKKAKTERFITRFARYYTPCVVGAALLLAILPPLMTGGWEQWIGRALIFLVVSCPCALVVSVPMTFFGGIGGASRAGILIKGAGYLETLAKVDTVVLDKTGTVTEGRFAVEALCPAGVSGEELLETAAAVESWTNHPVGESIVRAWGGTPDSSHVADVAEIPGRGIRAVVDGRQCLAGNAALMAEAGVEYRAPELSGTVVHVAREGEYLGHIVINDRVKEDSAAALAELKSLGIRETVILTGDAEAAARSIGAQVGADRVRWGLLPQDKVAAVEELLAQGRRLAFVGDGVNDAPVLARADVGIAMGALGSDAAIESADVVLMDDRPSKLPVAIRLARKTMLIVRQNIVFALGVKAVILVLGALGYANMWIAVFGDVGVMVIAILNAVRSMINVK